MSPSLMERARDGDAAGIAALLTSSLKPKGITVRAERESYTLHLWFTASAAPPQSATVAYARRAIDRLQVPSIGILYLYGEQQGFAEPAWREDIALLSSAAPPRPTETQPREADLDVEPPPASELEQPALDFEPLVSAELASTGVDRAYRELGLPGGSPLAEVEAVYFRRRAELLKKGDRTALEPLKWAFTTLKTHLEQAVAEAEPVYTSLGEDSPAAGTAPRLRWAKTGPKGPSPRPSSHSTPNSPPATDYTDVLSFQNPYTNGLLFPLLMGLGMLMNAMPIVNALLYGIKIWLHEFGHATIAWLAGRQALPLPIGWTTISTERSLFVYLGILTLLSLLWWAGRREGKRWPVVLAVALMVVQFAMTWLLPTDTFDMLFSFGGIGGEIYLSALLIVGFFFPLPEYFRWDFYRFPVVLGAAFCFWGQLWLWGQIRRGKASIPFGAMWGDADHGDMNQLINYHGWTPGEVIGTYSAIAHLGLFAIVAIYGYTLFRQHREIFIALGRQWLP